MFVLFSFIFSSIKLVSPVFSNLNEFFLRNKETFSMKNTFPKRRPASQTPSWWLNGTKTCFHSWKRGKRKSVHARVAEKARGRKALSLFRVSPKLFSIFSPLLHSTGKEDNTVNHRQEPKMSFLIKAIYTMAYGLQAYHEDVCGKDFVGVCPQLQKSFNHTTFFVRTFKAFPSLRN